MQTYGILAHPVEHSLSPTIHNAGFQALGINAEYVKFDVKQDGLKDFMQRVRDEKIAGLSISMPHKMEIMQYLDYINPAAESMKAVNCVYWEDGKLCGTNTDYYGAIRALVEKTDLKGKDIVIFGAGGAAHAIAYGLKEKKITMTILDRTMQKSQELACQYKTEYGLTSSHSISKYDIIINTTPLGMFPNTEGTILEAKDLSSNQLVYDIVYNPLNTKLIQEARKAGCRVITGERMFLYQAVKQFELWTDKEAPVEVMQKALMEKLV